MEQLWSNLGSLAHLGGLLSPTWAYLGLFGTILGCLGGYLGLFEAILGHLGGILGPRASKTPSGWLCLCPVIAVFANLGTHFGDQNFIIFGNSGDHFLGHLLIILWISFEHIVEPILGSDQPNKGTR